MHNTVSIPKPHPHPQDHSEAQAPTPLPPDGGVAAGRPLRAPLPGAAHPHSPLRARSAKPVTVSARRPGARRAARRWYRATM